MECVPAMTEAVVCVKNGTRRLPSFRLLLPISLGVLTGAADEVSANAGQLILSDPALYTKFLLFSSAFVALFCLLDNLLSNKIAVYSLKSRGVQKRKIDIIIEVAFDNLTPGRRAYIASLVFVLLCWIPWLILLSPGVYWSDSSTELIQYYGGEVLTDHHPILCTMIYGLFSDVGSFLFGSHSAGLFLLSVVQVISAAALFSAIVIQVRDMGVSPRCGMAALAFIAVFPFFPVMFVSIVKDTLSAIPFLLFILFYFKILNASNILDLKKWQIIIFLTCIVLTALTKKTMAYIVIPSTAMLLFVRNNTNRSRLVVTGIIVVSALVCFIAVPKILLPALGAESGGKQEAIATLIQQVAHDVVFNDENMSESDKEIVDDFLLIDYQDIPDLYNFEIVDNIKGRQLNNESRFWDFISLWWKKTLQDPLGHFEAWLGLTHGWFGFRNADGTPSYMVVCTESLWYYDPILQYIDWPQPDALSEFARAWYDSIQSMPIVNLLFYRSTWASIAPTFLLYYFMGKRHDLRRGMAYIMPVLLSALTLALTPVSGTGGEPTRYLFQIVCLTPFLLCLGKSVDTIEKECVMPVGQTGGAHYPHLK